MKLSRTEAYLILNLLPKIGPVRVRRLIDHLGSPEAILGASEARLREVPDIGPTLAERLARWEQHIDLPRERDRIKDIGAQIITREDEAYPRNLREIYDAPLVLYVWGDLQPRDQYAISIVGPRQATHYGTQAAKKLSFQLAHSGLTVVSGLALGIDTAAHEAALAARGRTIAVIGSGLGKLYPPENLPLAQKIADGHGAVISEFPVDYNADKQSFPLRNRIVAGLSQGTLVVEAAARSGALITASQATEYHRSVYAVPGPIDRSTSIGANRLIQQGAKLVMIAEDILNDLEWLISPKQQLELALSPQQPRQNLTPEENQLYIALGTEEGNFDQLVERTGLTASAATVALMKLEMKKLIRPLPGRNYVRLV